MFDILMLVTFSWMDIFKAFDHFITCYIPDRCLVERSSEDRACSTKNLDDFLLIFIASERLAAINGAERSRGIVFSNFRTNSDSPMSRYSWHFGKPF